MPAPQRREQLLDSAATVILKDGFDAATMEAITAEAGVSKALGYSYFERIDDLFQALFDREFSAIYPYVRERMEAENGLENKLRGKVDALLEITAARRDLYIVLDRYLMGPSFTQGRDRRRAEWIGYVAGLFEAELGVSKTTAETMASLVQAVDNATMSLYLDPSRPVSETKEITLQLNLSLLKLRT
ncbi:MAG: TetR/AcrR family transcriptional regulator [Actinomycetota bacterium]|nr:TetR/AcrR family transcriptional regulator [Actinomycetota bacterium]